MAHFSAKTDEWVLTKGRRNVGEVSSQTVVREAAEETETGYSCQLLPVTMATRALPAVELGDYPDEARIPSRVCEPLMMSCRQLDDGCLKIIKWYIAEMEESALKSEGEHNFRAELLGFAAGLDKLTFGMDRDVVRAAIKIFDASYEYLYET